MRITRTIVPTALLVIAAVACGTNECDDACDKIEECNPGSVCTVNGDDCSGQALEIAECINDSPCDRIGECLLGSPTGTPTGTGTGVGTGTGAGSGTGSGVATNCAALCDLAATSTPTQDACVADIIVGLGYPTATSVPCNLLTVDKTVANCNACYGDVSVSDADCQAAHAACF